MNIRLLILPFIFLINVFDLIGQVNRETDPSTMACSPAVTSVSISPTSTTICQGSSINLVSSFAGSCSGGCSTAYTWHTGSSSTGPWSVIGGATSSVYAATATSGTVYYYVSFNCGGTNIVNSNTVSVSGTSSPSNDACASATSLGSGTFSTSVSSTNQCANTDNSGCTYSNSNVWYSFTTGSSASGYYVDISLAQGTMQYGLTNVLSGSCGSWTCVSAGSYAASGTATNDACLSANTTYYIMVASALSGTSYQGTYTLNVTVAPKATNDACTNAISLGSGAFSTSVSSANLCMTQDNGTCTYSYSNTWYTLTTGASSTIINLQLTQGGLGYGTVALLSGSCGSLTGVTCNTYSSSGSVQLSYCGAANTTYYVMVGSAQSASSYQGSYTLTANVTTNNDACANAIPLTLSTYNSNTLNTVTYSVTTQGTNICATADQSSTSCYTNFHNVWYTFTVPVTGNYNIGIDGSTASGYLADPQVALMAGTCGSFTTIGCAGGTSQSTQADGGIGYDYSYAGGCNLTAGTTYYIMVDDLNGSYTPGNIPGAQGAFNISISSLSNDVIASAGILPSCGTSFTGSTKGATNCTNCIGNGYYNDLDCNTSTTASGNSSGADSYAGMSVENDSWFQFCTTTATTYTVTMSPISSTCVGPNTALQMNLFSGSPTALTWLCGSATSSSLSCSVSLATNGCAYVQVDGDAGTNCDYNLTLTANPACALPISLLSFSGENVNNQKIVLNWSVASETNVKSYLVQRSYNGVDFTENVAQLAARGTTNIKGVYTVSDMQPQAGYNYYRLVSVDANGEQRIAGTTLVTNRAQLPSVLVYPNPTTGQVNVNLVNFSTSTGNVAVDIFDGFGKQVSTVLFDLTNGENVKTIDLSVFPDGIYFIKTSDGETTFKKSLLLKKN